MFFHEDHLRITKVRTLDGISPLMGEDERPQKKIVFAPLNPQTKKLFEEENSRKPNQLKMKIEVVKAYQPEPIPQGPSSEVLDLQAKIKALEAENNSLKINKVSSENLNGSESTEKTKEKSTNNSQTKVAQL